MTNTALQMIISTLIGSVVVVNGVALNSEDVINTAKDTVNQANIHQIATVLELYYLNHDQYPVVEGGEELINLFEEEKLIRNRPLDANVFHYTTLANGQDYDLSVK